MYAVVSVLDPANHRVVELLWEGLQREFGIRPRYRHPIPHFTYHVAEHYHLPKLKRILQQVAWRHRAFDVHAGGLGLFTGNKRVVHVPMVRNAALNALHREIWRRLEPLSKDSVGHFHPELWIPHVTLAYQGLTPELLPPVVAWLAERSFRWDLRVDNLTVISHEADAPPIGHQVRLLEGGDHQGKRG